MPTEPKNFYTTGPKKGNPATSIGVLFQKEFPEHMTEPYDLPKELRKKEIDEHNAKLIEGKKWKPMHHGGVAFQEDITTYGTELKFKDKKPPRKAEPQVDHPRPFKPSHPSKKGTYGQETISNFPEHILEKNFQQKKK